MSSRMSKAASFPKLERSNTSRRRKIIGNPYDSDSDVSFVQPYGDKKCTVKFPTLMDKISNNAAELQHFGQSLAFRANHVIQTFVASETEGDEDSDDSRRTSRALIKAMVLIEKASGCAASIRAVADEVPEACMTANPCFGLIRDNDEYFSSDDEMPKRRMRKKKASEAKPHDGKLSEDISITTDAYSCSTEDYSSIASDGSSNNSIASDGSNSTVESAKKTRLEKLRRRRKKFLRRRALEHAADTETEDEEEASFHFGGPRLRLEKKPRTFPSQELRCNDADLSEIDVPTEQMEILREASPEKQSDSESAVGILPDLVNTSIENWLDTTNEDDFPKNTPSLPSAHVIPDAMNTSKVLSLNIQSHAPRRLSSHTNSEPSSPSQLKWQSMDKLIPHLSPSPDPSYIFLTTSHLGPTVTRTPWKSMDEVGLQLSDVIIRLSGKDVRSLEAKAVCEMINDMTGESVRVTFLRKNMML